MKKQRKLKGLRRFLTHGLITAAVLTALLLPLTASAETSTEQAVAQLEGRIEYVKRTIKEAERTPFVPALENELLHLYRELARIQPQENDPALLKSADERGKITGKVTDAAGKAIGENVEVCAYKIYPNGRIEWGRSVCTKANEAGKYILPEGVYTLAGLESGEYKLWFVHDPPAPTVTVPEPIKYQDQWYQDAPFSACAEPVTVAFGKTTKDINVQLALRPTGKISGKVTDKDGGAGLGVDIHVVGDNGVSQGGSSSSTDGTYAISELPAGNYTVHFKPSGSNYLDQYYKGTTGTTDITSADTVAVEDGKEKKDINAQLDKGGIITGRVTSNDNKPVFENWNWDTVTVYDKDNNQVYPNVDWSDLPEEGTTASEPQFRKYTIQGLPAGDYTLKFKGFSNSQYHYTGWWGGWVVLRTGYNAWTCDESVPPICDWEWKHEDSAVYIPKTIEVKGVTQGDTPKPQNVVLEQGGSISGIVKAKDSGKPVSNRNWDSVTVYDKDDNQVYPDPADWSVSPETTTTVGAMQFHKYTIKGLAAGDYTLKFKGFNNSSGYKAWTCDKSVPPICDWEWKHEDYAHYAFASESVKVTVGAEAAKDVALERGGSISGILTDAATGSLARSGNTIIVYDKDGNEVVSSRRLDSFYKIESLAAGTYTVTVETFRYLSESRDGVVVRSNDDTPNINFVLKEDDSRFRSISGRVTKDKKPYGCVSVDIYQEAEEEAENDWSYYTSKRTNHKGEYVLYNATPSKSYKVSFERNLYKPSGPWGESGHWGILDHQWYSCKTDIDSAKVVHAGKSNVNACFTASGDFCGCGTGMMIQTIITPFLLNRSNK